MGLKVFYCFMMLSVISFSRSIKTVIKSIQSKDGDVIDCVHITRQPAFDNPLLKDNIIQTRPKLSNKLSKGNNSRITQLWQLSGSCPEETIPIRRTEEILTRSSIHGNLHAAALHSEQLSQDTPKLQVAHAIADGEFYGAKASRNVWEPKVEQPTEFTTSLLSVSTGDSLSTFSGIHVGWHVYPIIYNDSRTRLFINWLNGAQGCFNLECSGFIQTSNEIVLGGTLSPLSTYHGGQFYIDISVLKYASQDVWWLQVGDRTVGYWPTSLMPALANNASRIIWGGVVLDSESNGQQTTTQMGSGHLPEEGIGGASFMKNLQVMVDPKNFSALSNPFTFVDRPSCYNITIGKSLDWGDYILYGGPGRNPNCP